MTLFFDRNISRAHCQLHTPLLYYNKQSVREVFRFSEVFPGRLFASTKFASAKFVISLL